MTGDYGFVLKDSRFRIFHNLCGKTLEEIAQRGGGCSIPGNIQGWMGGSEKPDQAEYILPGESDQMTCKGERVWTRCPVKILFNKNYSMVVSEALRFDCHLE